MERFMLKLRWIYAACYEIVLPNGKVIVTDPFVTPDHIPNFTADDFTGADYIFCSHTHYDHTSDIGYLTQKFNSKVICNEMSAPYLAKFFDMNYSHLYPIASGETLIFDDFTVTSSRAKHTVHPLNRDTYSQAGMTSVNNYGLTGHEDCDRFGWMELLDYMLTFRDNTRLFLVAGIDEFGNIYQLANEKCPNILIRQTEGKTPEEYAGILNRFHSLVAFPNHHEMTHRKYGMEMDEFSQRTEKELQRLHSGTAFVNPDPYKWYEIGLNIKQV